VGRSGKLSRVALGRGVARARWSLCDGTVLCRLLNTGTAEWAPDEAEEKKYKYCGSVVIGGSPRPSPSFFSLCKHCKDTCAVDWLVARPRGGPHEFRQGARSGVATRGGLAWQLEFRKLAEQRLAEQLEARGGSAVPRHASRVANSGAQRRPRGDPRGRGEAWWTPPWRTLRRATPDRTGTAVTPGEGHCSCCERLRNWRRSRACWPPLGSANSNSKSGRTRMDYRRNTQEKTVESKN
jgi:hypothetical protein